MKYSYCEKNDIKENLRYISGKLRFIIGEYFRFYQGMGYIIVQKMLKVTLYLENIVA